MTTSIQNLTEFLKVYKCTDRDKLTHTKIGHANKEYKLYGGAYNIPEDKLSEFYKHYYKHVFTNGNKEYLTEKQQEDGPILVDFDFRYPETVEERIHTKEHITDIIELYIEKLKEIVEIKEEEKFPIYIFEKTNVNTDLDDKTKDGIHMIIGINLKRSLQIILRERVLREINEVWTDLKEQLTNDWDDVLDNAITKGINNWQLYGSRKPLNDAYSLKYVYDCCFDCADDDIVMEELDARDYERDQGNFPKLSVQYKDHATFEMKESIKEEFEKVEVSRQKKRKPKLKITSTNTTGEIIPFNQIDNEEKLDMALAQLFERVEEKPEEYKFKEVHEYTMILPVSYYGPGSFSKWIRVGWALRNTGFEMYLTWLKMSCKSNEFKWDNVGDLFSQWCNFEKDNDGLTSRSILYWARSDCPKEYNIVKEQTIDFYIEESIKEPQEYNLAVVLHQWYKDNFVCVSVINKKWYEYRKQKWYEVDSGTTLRKNLSTTVYKLYTDKAKGITDSMNGMPIVDQGDEKWTAVAKKATKVSEIAKLFKKTGTKTNIMKEALDLFYEAEFLDQLDSKNHLLCFNNGVIDFEESHKEKMFRIGRPDDWNSFSTKIDYQPIDRKRDGLIIEEIDDFMSQLFPVNTLKKYMWEHLASVLIGKNENQTFNIYTGAGSNGKSKLVELMSLILGDYKGTVPVSLITQKRPGIGGTSSEVAGLQGKRYAVMQEPSKGDRINEGIMKELTGGDPLQARHLYKDSVTFIPQFKLAVCTNTLFDINSNDNGTWRRIRICDFMSTFKENPVEDADQPYQFKIDKHLDKKFTIWKQVFMAMLVDVAFRTKGDVADCDIVMAKSETYREGQDHLSKFVKDNIEECVGSYCKKTEITTQFDQWYKMNIGANDKPKAKEVHEFMDKKYGSCTRKGWKNIKLTCYDDEEEDAPEDI